VKALPNINKVVLRGDNIPTKTSVISGSLSSLGIKNITNSNYGSYYVDETKPEGTAYAKWISRVFVFENSCDGIELRLTSVFYDVRNIRCYYKMKAVGFDGDVADLNWVPFNPDGTASVSENGVPTTVQVPGMADNSDKIKPRTYSDVDPYKIEAGEWNSLTFSAQNLARFDGISIKIVMNADNPCQVPLIDDFMMICSE